MIAVGSILSVFKGVLSKPNTYVYLTLIVSVIFSIALWRGNKRLRSEVERKDYNYNVLDGEFIKEKDAHGQDVLKLQELELTKDELINAKDSITRLLIKEAKLNGIKDKQITDLQIIISQASNSIDGVGSDTIYVNNNGDTITWTAPYNDGYLDARVEIKNDNKSTNLTYTYTDSIFIIGHWERKPLRLFKRDIKWIRTGEKETYIDIKYGNPNATVLYSKKIKVYKNKKQYRKQNKLNN